MTETTEFRIPGRIVVKMGKLIHMRYKPAEIAGIIGVSVDSIYRRYLPAGAPCEKDTQGNIWIIGDVFAGWARSCVRTTAGGPAKTPMQAGQAYCTRCNQVIDLQAIKRSRPNARGVISISGRCPLCKGKANRFIKKSEAEK